MIPVLIVPVLNRGDLLLKMLDSIDHPVEQIVILDNSGGRATMDVVSRLRSNESVICLPHNIGVGAAWNLGLKVTPLARFWVIANSDITFGPGDLAGLERWVLDRPDDDPRIVHMLGMAAFAMTAQTLDAVGYFDENIHPAYNEDLDYERRARLVGVPLDQVPFTGTHVGSATIHSDPILRERNGFTHSSNDAYYNRKWGGPKQGGEVYSRPFGKGGHVGDWRLDPARLRNNAWPDR